MRDERQRLADFAAEPLEKLLTTFGSPGLGSVLLDMMIPLLKPGEAPAHLRELVVSTRGRHPNDVGHMGGNAASLLVAIQPDGLELLPLDLNSVSLRGARFLPRRKRDGSSSFVDLSGCNLRNADLYFADMEGTILIAADMRSADLSEVIDLGRTEHFISALLIDDENSEFFCAVADGRLLRMRFDDLTDSVTELHRV